jgi:N utilization substance protein A
LTDAIANEEKVENAAEDLLALEGMDIDIARELAARGINTQSELADLAADDLVEMTGIDIERANSLIMKAREPWFV